MSRGMHRFKIVLRVGGMAILGMGVVFLPIGFGVNPKRDTSAFYNLADFSAFAQMGLLLVAVGLVALAVSHTIPDNRAE